MAPQKRNMYLFVLFRDSRRDEEPQFLTSTVAQGLSAFDLKGAVRYVISKQAIFCNHIFAQVYEFIDGHFVFYDVIPFEYDK